MGGAAAREDVLALHVDDGRAGPRRPSRDDLALDRGRLWPLEDPAHFCDARTLRGSARAGVRRGRAAAKRAHDVVRGVERSRVKRRASQGGGGLRYSPRDEPPAF